MAGDSNNKACPCDTVVELKKIVERQGEQIQKHQEQLYNNITAFELLRKDIELLTRKLEINSQKLSDILEKPAKNWDSMIGQIISLVIAALVGFFLSKNGL